MVSKRILKEKVYWLSSRNFFRGAKSIVMQISFVMQIFLLFSDKISGGQKSPRGANCLRGAPSCPPWKKASIYLEKFSEIVGIVHKIDSPQNQNNTLFEYFHNFLKHLGNYKQLTHKKERTTYCD